MELFSLIIGPLSLAAAVLGLVIVLALGLWCVAKFEGYDIVNEMVLRDNPALGLRYAVFLFAVVFTLVRIFDQGRSASAALSLIEHALIATLLIFISRYLNDWLILYDFSNNREVVDEKNLAVAMVEGSTYLASAYIIAGAFQDWQNGVGNAVLWFAIGQLLLVLLAALYRVVALGVSAALDRHNVACAVSLGAFLIAGGMVCGSVVTGPSHGWQQDLLAVAIYMLAWLALMMTGHWLSERMVLRSSRLGDEVMEQSNLAVALFKAVLFLTMTLGYTHG